MKTAPIPTTPSAPVPAPASSEACPPANGRPTLLTEQLIYALSALIRETGVSDSGAAAQLRVHPSTLSRWKRDLPDLALLLRSAREDFRQAQLEIILQIAQAGKATSLRAATWLLERVFPQDYAPRATERARFQEQYEAACARELEGEILQPTLEEPLQNVQNPEAAAPPEGVPATTAPSLPLPCETNAASPVRTASLSDLSAHPPRHRVAKCENPALAGPIQTPKVNLTSAAA